jgi:hypothetical protein
MRLFITLLVTFVFIALCAGVWASHEAHADFDYNPHKHNFHHEFESTYNAEHGVFCGWRHGFEGISCVKVGD